jgi:hypothetical protein
MNSLIIEFFCLRENLTFFNRDTKHSRAFAESNGRFGWFPHSIVKKGKRRKGLDTETLPQVCYQGRSSTYKEPLTFLQK